MIQDLLIVYIGIDSPMITSPSALCILRIVGTVLRPHDHLSRSWNHNTVGSYIHCTQRNQYGFLFLLEKYMSVIVLVTDENL